MCVAGNVLKTRYYYYITTVTYFPCAKDANHSQMLGSPDPLVLSIPLKLIGADHGLHTSGGVQIFLTSSNSKVRRIRWSRSYAQVWFGR
jgi:hypothetical protein